MDSKSRDIWYPVAQSTFSCFRFCQRRQKRGVSPEFAVGKNLCGDAISWLPG